MSSRVLDRYLLPAGLALLTVALILGAFDGMSSLDWALVTAISFMCFINAVLTQRKP